MKIDSKKEIAKSLKTDPKKKIKENQENLENKVRENAKSRKSSQDNKERFKKTSSR